MSYKKPPIEDEPDVVPIVFTTILPPTSTTTMGHGLKWWMLVAIVAGMLLLVLAGGTVVQRDGASYTTIAEGLLVAMAANDDDCLPAVGTFSGTSMTTDLGEDDHFETCYQYGNASLYCWTKSYYDKHQGWLQCVPNGEGGVWMDDDDSPTSSFHTVEPQYVNPVTTPYSCGRPCANVHQYNV